MKVINEARNRILLLKGKPQKGSKTKRKSWKTSCLSCHQRLSFFFFFLIPAVLCCSLSCWSADGNDILKKKKKREKAEVWI